MLLTAQSGLLGRRTSGAFGGAAGRLFAETRVSMPSPRRVAAAVVGATTVSRGEYQLRQAVAQGRRRDGLNAVGRAARSVARGEGPPPLGGESARRLRADLQKPVRHPGPRNSPAAAKLRTGVQAKAALAPPSNPMVRSGARLGSWWKAQCRPEHRSAIRTVLRASYDRAGAVRPCQRGRRPRRYVAGAVALPGTADRQSALSATNLLPYGPDPGGA